MRKDGAVKIAETGLCKSTHRGGTTTPPYGCFVLCDAFGVATVLRKIAVLNFLELDGLKKLSMAILFCVAESLSGKVQPYETPVL